MFGLEIATIAFVGNILGLGTLGASALFLLYDNFFKKIEEKHNLELNNNSLKVLFENTNLTNEYKEIPTLLDFVVLDDIIRLKFALCVGVSKSDFESKKEYFLIYFKANDIKFSYDDEKNIDVEIIKTKFKDKYDFRFTNLKEPRKIFVGYSSLGDLIEVDIYKHLLVSGMTGFGKTVFLQTILLNALYNFKNLELDIFDFKCTDFVYFSKLENTKSFVCSVEDALTRLKELEQEMNNRYLEFQKYKVAKIEDYNNISRTKMNYKYILVDEIATLTSSKEGKECYKILSRIISKCRACGIFVIIATQRPDSTNLPSDIKANIGTVVGFKCNNKFSSEVICNKSCLEFLEHEGEGICFGAKEHSFKSMYLDSNQLKNYISKL